MARSEDADRPLRVLLVEDDVAYAELVLGCSPGSSRTPSWTPRSASPVRAALSTDPDVVIADVPLPEAEGLEVVADLVEADRPVTAVEAAQLQDMMRAVVTDGSAAFLNDVAGGQVAAKTGTAEYGTDLPPRTHAWMIGIHGDLAVAVFVEDGVSGSRTAGPILDAFLSGTA